MAQTRKKSRASKEPPTRSQSDPMRPRPGELTEAVERRILRFLNAAHIPEDLERNPQRWNNTAGEHGHDEEHIDDPEPERPPGIQIRKDLARDLIKKRPPLGYRELASLIRLDLKGLRELLEELIRLLGARMYGSWSTPVAVDAGGGPIPIQNAAMLRSGKVLLMPSSTDTLLWNPGTGVFELLNSATTGLQLNLFCSGHSFLSDGRLLALGGHGGSPGQPESIEAWKFDPIAQTWQKTAGNMAFQRWYPTVLTLGDEPGRVLVTSGWTGTGPAPRMEIYSETSDTFSQVTVTGPVGEKVFDQTYPGLHLLPGGEIFYSPTGFGDCSQSANPFAGTEPSGYFVFDTSLSGSWHDIGPLVRTKGMSALLLSPTYPFVRVLVVGGGTAAQSAQAQLINLSTLVPSWGAPFQLLEGRIHPNVVLLPDGTVFICGGMAASGTPSNGGRCELFDPVAGSITEMDELSYPRHYHSVAILLPSAQVMVVGGANDSGCSLSEQNTIEVFSPPYLFRGARPTFAPLPAIVHHGQTFEIQTPNADAIARVVLVRPMAATHQTDTEQRVVQLPFHKSRAGVLTATMPNGLHPHGVAPRGHYMVFIVNTDGVPSEARFVFLH
jgi:Galactose oxidase-like, Early set domain